MKKKDELTIIIDTREQRPYIFYPTPVKIQTLKTGDYSVLGMEDIVSVERKSLDDFIASISWQRERFRREMERLSALPFSAVVIEAKISDITGQKYRSRMTPESALATALSWSMEFKVPFFFAESRAYGAIVTEKILWRAVVLGSREKHIYNGTETVPETEKKQKKKRATEKKQQKQGHKAT
jgi:DNA excision repair protein ERCC-4